MDLKASILAKEKVSKGLTKTEKKVESFEYTKGAHKKGARDGKKKLSLKTKTR